MALKKTGVFLLLVLLTCICCLFYNSRSHSLSPWINQRPTPARGDETAPQRQLLQNSQESSVNFANLRSILPPYATAAATSTTSSSTKTGYILTRSFGGQLTRAVKNLMMQQCWARDLSHSAAILEPFSQESQLLHSPQIWEAVKRKRAKNVARFGDYFDLRLYNNASLGDGGAPLVSWEEFLLRAPREAMVVVTPPASCSLIVNRHLQVNADKSLKELLFTLQRMNFKIVRIVSVNCYDRYRGGKLRKMLLANLHNTTIVFNTWRNYNVARTWLDVSPRCNISDKFPAGRLKPSNMMRRHTRNYRQKILGGADKTIAIMLRVERFLILRSSQKTAETVDSCLEKTLSVYSDLKRKAGWSNSQPFLTLDIGRYGSGLMQSNETVLKMNESLEGVTGVVEGFLGQVYGGRWGSIEEWEDSFLEATEGFGERGYVAMLQREIAVNSDCLILMGGGSFQEVAANHYLQTHPDPAQQCLHVVCAAKTLTKTLENNSNWRNKKHPSKRHRVH